MDRLRIQLQEITDNGAPESHERLVGALSLDFPHTIEVLTGPAPIERYTCAMHAFDLIEHPDYIRIINVAPSYIFVSTTFVQRLINCEKLVELPRPQIGALIIYFENGCVKHIGKLVEIDRVESKWGTGHLYSHGLQEVPASYGSQTRLFVPLDSEIVLDEFVEYAQEHGVEFQNNI